MKTLSQSELKELLTYEPDTGVFTWSESKHGKNSYYGRQAGTKDRGYVFIFVKGKKYPAHRLAWLFVHGYVPDDGYCIDHINGDRSDNRISNLRVVTNQENSANAAKATSRSKSGYRGVSLVRGRWQARISGCKGKYKLIGYFDTPEDAYKAYCEEKNKISNGIIEVRASIELESIGMKLEGSTTCLD